jgi:hypothetical protein
LFREFVAAAATRAAQRGDAAATDDPETEEIAGADEVRVRHEG